MPYGRDTRRPVQLYGCTDRRACNGVPQFALYPQDCREHNGESSPPDDFGYKEGG